MRMDTTQTRKAREEHHRWRAVIEGLLLAGAGARTLAGGTSQRRPRPPSGGAGRRRNSKMLAILSLKALLAPLFISLTLGVIAQDAPPPQGPPSTEPQRVRLENKRGNSAAFLFDAHFSSSVNEIQCPLQLMALSRRMSFLWLPLGKQTSALSLFSADCGPQVCVRDLQNNTAWEIATPTSLELRLKVPRGDCW